MRLSNGVCKFRKNFDLVHNAVAVAVVVVVVFVVVVVVVVAVVIVVFIAVVVGCDDLGGFVVVVFAADY